MTKFDKSQMNEAFARVENVLDEAHTTLFGAIDGAFVVIDSYLDKVKVEVAKYVDPEVTYPTQEPVEREMTLTEKMEQVVKYRSNMGRSYRVWQNYLDAGIEPGEQINIDYLNSVWNNIPDGYFM